MVTLLPDWAAEQIAGLSPSGAAVALVEWRLHPGFSAFGASFIGDSIVYLIAKRAGPRLGVEMKIALAEGISWGLANGLLYLNFADPNKGALGVTRLATRLVREGKLRSWLPHNGFSREDLHPQIADACWEAVCSGDYDVAIFKAFRALEETAVKSVPACIGKSGRTVFMTAFDDEKGLLVGLHEDIAERRSWRDLFAGAYGAFRNPPAHRSGTKPDAAAVRDELILASLLMRKLEQALISPRHPPTAPGP